MTSSPEEWAGLSMKDMSPSHSQIFMAETALVYSFHP